jgi:hypothetical protein
MVIDIGRNALGALRTRLARPSGALVVAFVICVVPGRGFAAGKFCSATAKALLTACGHDVEADYWNAIAKCTNLSVGEERRACLTEAGTSRRDGRSLCRDQWATRRAACRSLGEERYDPEFDPASFDPDFAHLTNPNRYFPLVIGNKWEYRGGAEINTVKVLSQTKRIEGVTCIVVRDQVVKGGDLVEDTDDWYAQALDGTVWYCGEEVKDFESVDGDNPRLPELVSIDGSFKAGRDGDKPGIIFLASPAKGDVYLEEFSLANAEDVSEILSTTYSFGQDAELDRLVPQALAQALCGGGDCVVTKNYSLLEPGVFARKYYAPGIGVFLEVDPDAGEVVQLVSCSFDVRCVGLPTP